MNMKIFLRIFLCILFPGIAYAQAPTPTTPWVATVVAACGGSSFTAGASKPLQIDLTGKLCDTGSGSGGTTNVNLTQVAGQTLGAITNYGTSPGAVLVPGVNAFVTNTVPVTGTFFQVTQPISGTVTANQGTSPWVVGGPVGNGVATTGNPVWQGGWDGTNTYGFRATNAAIANNYTPPTTGLQQVQSFLMASNGDGTYSPPTAISTSTSIPAPAAEYLSILNEGRPYASTATPLTASSTGTTGATTATLAGASSKTTYICGFTITSDATAALAGTATVTGTISGTLSFIQNVGGATAAGILTQTFSPCIPASATNTAIAVNSVAAGTGGNTAVTTWGLQQ